MLPFLCEFISVLLLDDFARFCFSMNPFFEAAVVMDLENFRTAFTALEYRWPTERLGAVGTLSTITIAMLFHAAIGVFFMLCAKKRLRENIF